MPAWKGIGRRTQASIPEARQKLSKLAVIFASASILTALAGIAVDVTSLFMALLSSRGISTRAYKLKASNAAPPISTFTGTPRRMVIEELQVPMTQEVRNLVQRAYDRLHARLRGDACIAGARCRRARGLAVTASQRLSV